MTRKAPGRSFGHDNRRIKSAGGTVSDSRRGSRLARAQGQRWIDNNGHLMHRTTAGLRRDGDGDLDLIWVNAHGAPFTPSWMRGSRKFEDLAWDQVHRDHPLLRDAEATFRDNAALGLKTEWEVKDLHPLASDEQLERAFVALALTARVAYGDSWHNQVQVKSLTNLRGGLPYAKKVLRHAYAAGFTTIVLPRGVHRFTRINEPYITFNRGGRV